LDAQELSFDANQRRFRNIALEESQLFSTDKDKKAPTSGAFRFV